MSAITAPLPSFSDFMAEDLRRRARSARDGNQVRRLLALAAIRDGPGFAVAKERLINTSH